MGKYYGKFKVYGVVEAGNEFTFRTFNETNSFKIVTGSCNRTGSTATTWEQMLSENANLFVHMGDLHYLDITTGNAQDYANGTDTALASAEMKNFFKITNYN